MLEATIVEGLGGLHCLILFAAKLHEDLLGI